MCKIMNILLLLSVFTHHVITLKYCSHGDIDTIRAPYVEECSTGKRAPSKTDFVNTEKVSEKDSSAGMDHMTITNGNTKVSNDTSTTFCYRFEYSSKRNETSVSKDYVYVHTQLNANFSCDHNSLCKEDGAVSHITLNGEPGKLFCCSSEDECNRPSKNDILAPLLCYNGTNSKNSDVVSCKDPDDLCAISTITIGDQIKHAHYCDNHRCLDNGISKFFGSYEKCKNISTSGNITEELCCCVHNRCNRPHSALLKDLVSPDYTNVKILVIGVVGGVALILLLSFIIYVLVKRHINKVKLVRDNARAVRMSYKEISADDVSNSETAHILNI